MIRKILDLDQRCAMGIEVAAKQTFDALALSPREGISLFGHGSRLPRDQGVQCLCRNDRPATDANGAKATSRNVIVERRPAKAGRMAGFPNAITDLRGIVLDGLH